MPTVTKTRKNSNPVSAEDRECMIAEAAYYRAEQRGFAGGEDDQRLDWLTAECEVDALPQGLPVSE
jgi:hypothetical protein